MSRLNDNPKVVCRVRSLYPFSSPEKSSLSFEKGEEIEVLSQLATGWWDGWCKGRRGWFPSNYVTVIETNPLLLNKKDRLLKKNQELDLNQSQASSDDENHNIYKRISGFQQGQHFPTKPLLTDGWTLRIAEDGMTEFYHNPLTGGLRWTHPSQEESDEEDYEGDYDSDNLIHHYRRSDSDNDDSTTHESFEDYHDFGTVRSRELSRQSSFDEREKSETNNIMSYWTKRSTPQGRIYYANLITHETTWDMSEIDNETGKLKMKQQEKFERVTKKRVSAEIKQDVPISWKSISMQMSQAVQDLNKTILRGDAGQLQIKVAGVVDVVRLMIYASRSSDKESPHLQVPQIRDPHRQVMTTLSKLILSAKAVPDTQTDFTKRLLTKVHNDTNELSNAVRKFIQACQVKNVLIEPINPRLIETRASEVDNNKVITNTFDSIQSPESSTIEERRSSNPKTIITDTASKTKYVLNQDLLVNIQSHAKQIMGTTNALCDASTNIYSIEQQNSQVVSEPDEEDEHYQKSDEEKFFLSQRSRSCVVILFQNLSTQVGQYLSILRDVDLSKVDSTQIPTLPEFQISKQKLFNSIGLLFSSVQTLTDINHNLRASINSVEESVKSVEDAIDTIISNLHQMVAERKMWMRKNEALTNTAAAEDETGSHSPIYSYFDLPTSSSTEGTPKFGTRPHRGSVNESDSESGALSKRLLQTINQHRPSVSTAVSKSMIRPGNDNIKRPLGYTHPNSSNIDTSSEYWYLGHDYPEEDLVFTAEKTIKGGTLAALVERLTLHNFIDMSFTANFLLTYRSFCTTVEFIDLLQNRYNVAPPEDLTPDELEIWTEKKQKLIRLRVCNVMKNWLENYYNDEDELILDKLSFFINTVICDSSSFSAQQLTRLIQMRREVDDNGVGLKKLIPNSTPGPIPILPRNMSSIQLLDVDPLEMARQLSLTDFKLYSSIRPIECLGKAWSREGNDVDNAVNVKSSIDYCNKLTAWVSESVLSHKEAKKRVVVVKYWAQIASRCLELNNYNTSMAIISAFDNSAVGRLKKTWELVSSRTSQTLSYIRKLMGSNRNFQEYREMIHSVNPPCIPFLGIYLQDLTFIEDGNPDYLKNNSKLINFAKQQKSAEVIREIKQFQSPPYILELIPELQEYIKLQLDNSRDIDFLYERSLELEPRVPVTDNTS